MKRISLIILGFFYIPFLSLQGQVIHSYGLKSGLVFASQDVYFTPLEIELPTDRLVGPGFYLFAEAFRGDKFSFQLDAGYISKGNRTSAESITVDHLNNDSIIINEGPLRISRFNYLSFSPMVRIRSEYSAATVYTLLGPELAFLLNYHTDSPYPLPDQNKMLAGISWALGLEYALGPASVFIEAQYRLDIMPVYNITPLQVSNSAVSVSIGLRR